MPSGNDQAEATRLCNLMLGVGSPVATVLPIRARLMTTMGTPTANGTEVVNAGGSAYAAQVFADGTASPSPNGATNGVLVNSAAAVTFTNMPDTSGVTGVKAVETWDNSSTPKRKQLGTLAVNKVTALGDSITFATSQLSAAVNAVLA